MNYEQIIMQIIMNGGDARAKALQAVRSARKGNLKEAEKLMEKSKESLSKLMRYKQI